jgi:cytidyltransferase-like protein
MLQNRGYCAVTADILHHGHINFIKKCREQCQELVVGVMTDYYIITHKKRPPAMHYNERAAVVAALKYVKMVVPQNEHEFDIDALSDKYKIGVIFDSLEHRRYGARVYFPYDDTISSSEIRQRILKGANDVCRSGVGRTKQARDSKRGRKNTRLAASATS